MVAEILVLLAAIGGSSWVVGMFAWLWHRVRVLEKTVATTELGPARGREDVVAIEELRERVDFLERLLKSAPAERRLPSSENLRPEEGQ